MTKFPTFSLALCLLAFTPSLATADEAKPRHLLTLAGHGVAKAAPDMALVDLGVAAQAPTAKAALEANTAKMTALFAMLKAAGIDEKDIQTTNFAVNPQYAQQTASQGGAPKVVGYEVTNSVTATVRKLGDLGTLLDKAVASGANQVNGISFGLNNPTGAADDARKAAVEDAIHRAQVLTGAAGVKLGALVTMSEAGGAAPMVHNVRMMAAGMGKADSAPVPVAQGQLEISADVNMVWELQ